MFLANPDGFGINAFCFQRGRVDQKIQNSFQKLEIQYSKSTQAND